MFFIGWSCSDSDVSDATDKMIIRKFKPYRLQELTILFFAVFFN